MRAHILTLALIAAPLLAGCGGSDKPVATPPSPSVKPDKWAIQMCDYLAKQDPGNVYANDFAVLMGRQSTIPEVVDLSAKAKAAQSSNLLRGWCQQHLPSAGATPG
ncbi:hypothetical protein [Actinomadura litoris]|uniref:hypothetical protein n=1 Tax=Actinomadura litoris TaxID=2678616 RepID=UPI001FA7B5EF|nr:hypothetical protein [Actinomadura litoris]